MVFFFKQRPVNCNQHTGKQKLTLSVCKWTILFLSSGRLKIGDPAFCVLICESEAVIGVPPVKNCCVFVNTICLTDSFPKKNNPSTAAAANYCRETLSRDPITVETLI